MSAGIRSSIAVAVVTLTALAVFAVRANPRAGIPVLSPDEEVQRIRTHLATVEAELLAADVSRLTPAQRTARARHVAVLREYRRAGVFPHNHTVADRRVPVFVDEHGTHCAVGYLLARDGRDDVVERVRATRNHATVQELADDPQIVAWLAEAGLTVEEAARIQPWYGPIALDESEPSHAYRNATLVAMGLSGVVSVWNLNVAGNADARELPGVLGMGIGAADVALGAFGLIETARVNNTRSDVRPGYVALNFGVGVLTTVLGLRNVLRGDAEVSRPAGAGSAAAHRVQWQLSPWAPALDGGAGVRLDLRF